MKKILMLGLCAVLMLSSMVVYAADYNQSKVSLAESTVIIIKGEKNIKAYEEAGIIKACTKSSSMSSGLEGNSIKSSSVPTKTWDLNNGSRSFTYSFKSYIYSNYKYKPCPDDIASTGYAIYHKFYPDDSQTMKLYTYDSSGSFVYSTTLDMDDTTVYGIAVKNNAHYFKYKSTDGTTISGSGKVY